MGSYVGFDRRLKLKWLDAVTSRMQEGKAREEVALNLKRMLANEVKGAAARRKTTTVLLHIWGDANGRTSALRNRALEMFAQLKTGERLWLHWGMSLTRYPFFHDVVSIVGKLLRLQGNIYLSHLNRRVTEQWGERTTVVRALQRIVRTMVDWHVLSEARTPGLYKGSEKKWTDSKELMLWFAEALLTAEARGCISMEELTKMPAGFPFELSVCVPDIEKSNHFEIQRDGLHDSLVFLK